MSAGALGWPGRPGLDSIEYQQFQRLDASLDALASLAGVLPHQSYESALGLWRDCLAATVFQPKTPMTAFRYWALWKP